MTIADAHTYLAENILDGLAITSPVQTSIKKVWPYMPPPSRALADIPAAMMTFEQRPVVFGPALLHKPYTISLQIFAASFEDETGWAKAAAFMDALITKLASTEETIRLGTTNGLVQGLRGEAPETMTLLSRGDRAYIGLDLKIDLQFTTTPGYSS